MVKPRSGRKGPLLQCHALCILVFQKAICLIQLHLRQHPYPDLQVLERGFHNLKAHVTTFTSASLTPDEFGFDLELTYAWSVMIEVFVALQSKVCTSRVPPPELVHMLASYMDVMSSLTQ